MARTITLRMAKPEDEARLYQSYLMKVEVIAAEEISDKIFVMQRSLAAAVQGEPPPEPVDRFRSIADPVDLEQYPEDAPDLANDIPFYRAASVELLFRNMTDLQDTWTDIQEDVQGLIDALNTGLTNPVTEDVVIS